MDQERYAVLLLDLRRFLELPGVRAEFFGALMPDGLYYSAALQALAELERMAAGPPGR